MTPEQLDRIRAAARAAVDGWPPLSEAQQRRLRVLLHGADELPAPTEAAS